jgi:hypothetical protein
VSLETIMQHSKHMRHIILSSVAFEFSVVHQGIVVGTNLL